MRRHAIVLLVAFSASGASFLGNAYANGDLCTSAAFQDAFHEGQNSPDYTARSQELLAFGGRAVPCLKAIAKAPGAAANIHICSDNPRGCADWALAALGEIGTQNARKFLVSYLHEGKDATLISTAIVMLGRSKAESVRPALKEVLTNPNAVLRAQAVRALAEIGNRRGFEVLLGTTLSLPDNLIPMGVEGMLLLGDPRAVEPLQKRAATISEPTVRASVERTIAQLGSKGPASHP